MAGQLGVRQTLFFCRWQEDVATDSSRSTWCDGSDTLLLRIAAFRWQWDVATLLLQTVENLLMWKADSKNTLWFIKRQEVYDLFNR